MKLKQLILSSIAVGALAFTFGTAQPAQAAIGMENPGPAMNPLKAPHLLQLPIISM